MTTLDGLILGLVQGLTEFLPVSSTGHLILIRDLLNISGGGLVFDATLHLATLGAVAIYFHNEIWELIVTVWRFITRQSLAYEQKQFAGAIIWGTVPAVALGLSFRGFIEGSARNSIVVALALIAGSFVMWWAERVAHGSQLTAKLNSRLGFRIGLFQALALIPGMSRSGSTIAGGLFNHLSREQATRFAFVLSFPILLGAGGLSFLSLLANPAEAVSYGSLFVGMLAALASGLAAIHFLIRYLKTHTLSVFIWYRVVLAIIIFTAVFV